MRIAIDARSLVEAHPTGVTRYVRGFVSALASSGDAELTLWTFGRKPARFAPEIEALRYRHVHTPVSSKEYMLAARIGIARPFEELVPGMDWYCVPSPAPLALTSRSNVALIIHDCTPMMAAWMYGRKQRFWHWLAQTEKQIASAKAVFAVSERTQHDLAYLFPRLASRVHVLSPSTETIVQPQTPDKKHDQNYFLQLGTLETRKNQLDTIRGWEMYRRRGGRAELVLIGKSGFGSRAVYASIAASQFRQHVHVLSYVADDQIASWIANAQVFLFPSLYEGFGFPVVDAVHAGVPVIASAEGAVSEVVRDGLMAVRPFHPEEIAFALEYLENNPKRRQRMIERARATLHHQTWPMTARTFLDVLRSFQ